VGLLVSVGVWIGAVALTRYVSVGSMLAGVALMGSAFLLQEEPLGGGRYVTTLSVLAAVLVMVRHRDNIRRLIRGTEHTLGHRERAE